MARERANNKKKLSGIGLMLLESFFAVCKMMFIAQNQSRRLLMD